MRFRKAYAAVIALLIIGGFVGRLSAAGDNNGNPTILQAVEAVASTLNGLVTTVNDLATALNEFVDSQGPGNASFTPPVVAFAPDTIICTATNVNAASRTVRVQMVDGNTAASLAENSPTGFAVGPGLSTAAVFATPTSARAFCKFTVLNGNKTDIRAVLALFAAATASDKLTIAAE